jgi:hypothetical protein
MQNHLSCENTCYLLAILESRSSRLFSFSVYVRKCSDARLDMNDEGKNVLPYYGKNKRK